MKVLQVVKDESERENESDVDCVARTAFGRMQYLPYEGKEPGRRYLRNEAVDGSLVLFRGDNIVSRGISCLSGSPYSHAGLVLRWGDRVLLIEAATPSVHVKPLSIAVAEYDGIADLYVPRAPLPQTIRDELITVATAHLSVRFSVVDLGLLGLYTLFRRRFVEPRDGEDDLVCSEFVARVYGRAGEALVGKKIPTCGNTRCLAQPRPTLDGAETAEESYASSVAPAQLLCSRRFRPVGRFSKDELGDVKTARERLVAEHVAKHRKEVRAQRGTPIK